MTPSKSALVGSHDGLPTVSVIIPAKNEAEFISACLKSLNGLDYPDDKIEIVVVDNGSMDRTTVIAEAHGVRVLHHPSGRVGSVRNAGAKVTCGAVLAFLDADCVVGDRWLAASVAQLADSGVGAAGGGYLADREGSWVQRAWAPTEAESTAEVEALPGGSLILRRHTFEAIGGFDEILSAGEDDDICRRIRDLGLRVVAVQEAWVVHLGYPRSLAAVARRQIWHGSNQIDVAESWLEPQLVMTHAFVVALLSLPILITARVAVPANLAACAALFGPPLVMAISKSRRRNDRLGTFIRMAPVGVFFYGGRAIGLIRNYGQMLKRRR